MTKNPTEENFKKVDELLTKFFKEREGRVQADGEIQKDISCAVIGGALDNLPKEKHDEFLTVFTENLNDGEIVTKYLKDNGIEDKINEILNDKSQEFVNDLIPDKEVTTEIHSEGRVPVK